MTPVPMTLKVDQVDNFDWGQEGAPDGRPDHRFPSGVQNYVLEPYESVAVSLYKNPNSSSSPFRLRLFNEAVSRTEPVWSGRMAPQSCTRGSDTDPTCYWKPSGAPTSFSTVDGSGASVNGTVTSTTFARPRRDDMLSRIVFRANGAPVAAPVAEDVNPEEPPMPSTGRLGAAKGVHPTTITNDTDLTLTFDVSDVNPDGHQSGRARPDDPYPRGFQGMVLKPGESKWILISPDLTGWALGGDDSRSNFTITASSDGVPVFTRRINVVMGGSDYSLVTGYDWGFSTPEGSFMDRRYIDVDGGDGGKQRIFLWSYGDSDAKGLGPCDGVHWCMPRELRIEKRA